MMGSHQRMTNWHDSALDHNMSGLAKLREAKRACHARIRQARSLPPLKFLGCRSRGRNGTGKIAMILSRALTLGMCTFAAEKIGLKIVACSSGACMSVLDYAPQVHLLVMSVGISPCTCII